MGHPARKKQGAEENSFQGPLAALLSNGSFDCGFASHARSKSSAQDDRGRAMSKTLVSIVMGSDSDLEIMREAGKALDEFGIAYEIDVTSAHRSPDRTADFARRAAERGIRVIIAGAGGAAHLAGVIAAHTTLPVVGVPIPSTSLQGMDSLLATVQMPAGIPVATVAIGKPGATNAGILAAQMIALADASVAKKLLAHKEKLARGVEEKSRKLKGL
jgi:phosphoribosylaminoimidazole carboxylase PurE protein